MAVLDWVKSKKVFLKVQSGTGDALSTEKMLLMISRIMFFGLHSDQLNWMLTTKNELSKNI